VDSLGIRKRWRWRHIVHWVSEEEGINGCIFVSRWVNFYAAATAAAAAASFFLAGIDVISLKVIIN
jgi:hypothetical protein